MSLQSISQQSATTAGSHIEFPTINPAVVNLSNISNTETLAPNQQSLIPRRPATPSVGPRRPRRPGRNLQYTWSADGRRSTNTPHPSMHRPSVVPINYTHALAGVSVRSSGYGASNMSRTSRRRRPHRRTRRRRRPRRLNRTRQQAQQAQQELEKQYNIVIKETLKDKKGNWEEHVLKKYKNKEEIPRILLCPLSLVLIEDPVYLVTAEKDNSDEFEEKQTFDRKSIINLINHSIKNLVHPKSPFTRRVIKKVLPAKEYYDNIIKVIEENEENYDEELTKMSGGRKRRKRRNTIKRKAKKRKKTKKKIKGKNKKTKRKYNRKKKKSRKKYIKR